jgi:TRAP transporter TAXI family solute receptor
MRKAFLTLIFSGLPGLVLAQQTVFIGSGSSTGAYFGVASGFAKLVNDAGTGVRVNVRPTEGSLANLEGLASGDLQMALVSGDVAYYAYTGGGLAAFEKKPIKGLKSVAYLFPEVVHIFARAGSEIRTLADLKGKRVAMGEAGSSTEASARLILGAYSLAWGDFQPVQVSPAQGLAALQDGTADAVFYVAAVGAPALQQAAQAVELRALVVEPSVVETLARKYPFYTPVLVPGGVYKGVDVTTPAIGVQVALLASENLSADLLYGLMKLTFGDEAALKGLGSSLARFDPRAAVKGLPAPLHPGAEKYWVERGVIPLQ